RRIRKGYNCCFTFSAPTLQVLGTMLCESGFEWCSFATPTSDEPLRASTSVYTIVYATSDIDLAQHPALR
ncbi:hypothetical protein OAD38_01420, partial [Ascidiaceihabitans sp.]|nr:hypothetical protein [Ascidiaceihabitans sp.]